MSSLGRGHPNWVLSQSEIMAAVTFPFWLFLRWYFEFCSPLAYISIHYRSIGRQVTRTHTKPICFGETFRLKSCLSWRWNGQIRATKNTTNGLSVDATSLNWGTASYVSLKSTLTSKVPCNWSLENLRVVWSSQVILVSSFVYFAKYYGRLMYCSQIALRSRFSDACVEFKLCKLVIIIIITIYWQCFHEVALHLSTTLKLS